MIAGTRDILLITFDTLRYDVARDALREGLTPNLAALLPKGAWELRHTPGSFTYSAHQAFFAGFFPTPVTPGPHARPLALAFEGSESIDERTVVLDGANIIEGFRKRGHYTICIGGTGFFNKRNPLGNAMPSLFDESHWSPDLGVMSPRSTELQVRLACERLAALRDEQRVFLFLNVSALHQPPCDSVASQKAALAIVDAQLPPLFEAMRRRAPVFAILCSDHGTAFGEDGYRGHRLAHEVVWNVPYAEIVLR